MVLTMMRCLVLAVLLVAAAGAPASAAEGDADEVRIVIECEDMEGVSWEEATPAGEGFSERWTAGRWGRDLYQQNTFGGHWSSRMANAVVAAGETQTPDVHRTIEVPRAGRYKVWAKYECPPFYNYPFAIRIRRADAAEGAAPVFDQTYGLRSAPKHFSFTDRLQTGDLYWTWGMDHDAAEGYEVDLEAGRYTVTLAKAPDAPAEQGPSAGRSVDAILLTSVISELSAPDFPRFPLLDELMKANRVFLRFTNTSSQPVVFEWNHWSHRYNYFYYPDPSKTALVRFYGADGQMLRDESGAPLSRPDGRWVAPIEPGESTPWINWGPALTTENSSPLQATASAVDADGTKLAQQPEGLTFKLDIALEPSEAAVVKSFEKAAADPALAVVIQPDLHREEGREHTLTTTEVYRRMTAQMEATPRVGPMPSKLRLMASFGTPYTGLTDENGLPPALDVGLDYGIAMGINTTSVPVGDTPLYDAVAAYYQQKGVPFIELAGRFHFHTQDPREVRAGISTKDPGSPGAPGPIDPKAQARLYYNSFGDEIGLPAIDLTDETMLAAFRQFLRERNVTAEEIGFASIEEAKPLGSLSAAALVGVGLLPAPGEGEAPPALPQGEAGAAIRRLYWHSHLFHIDRGIADFAEKTREMTAIVGPHFKTTANLGGMHPFYWVHQAPFIDAFRGHAMTLAWSEDYDYGMPEASRLVTEFLAAYLRAGAKYHDTPMQFYNMPHFPGNTGTHLLQNAVSLWGQGIKDLDFFGASPDTWTTENYLHSRGGIETAAAIRRISGMAGNIEDHLLPARTRQAKVAILLSEASDVWELQGQGQWAVAPGSEGTNVSQEERKAIWNCLRRHGYLVDLVTENDLADGRLSDYRVLYVCGHNLERRSAPVIREWVEAGGRVYLTAGAARKDEYDEPFDGLDEVVGRGAAVRSQFYRGPLRAKLELPRLAPLGQALVPAARAKWPVLASYEIVEPGPGAEVRGGFAPAPGGGGAGDGAVASPEAPAADAQLPTRGIAPFLLEKPMGQGRGYYVGALPGQAYLRKAIPVKPMGKGGPESNFTHFEPIDFDEAAAATILLPVRDAQLAPEATADHRNVVLCVLDGPQSTVVTAVNLALQHDGPLRDVTLTLRGTRPATAVSTALKAETTFENGDEGVKVTLGELTDADVVVIKH